MTDTAKTTSRLVVVENLRYRYPRGSSLALEDVSFEAGRGEFVGIIGANGAGKSTLCHALVGLVPHFYKGAVGGTVVAAGLDVHKASPAEVSRRVGLVFQNPFTQITGAKLTVYEEVAFGLEYAGVPRDEMVRRIDEALRRLGLWSLRDRNPYALSGGQMQRLAIASVLAMQPDVLVLDEPTSQLDPAGTREVFDAVAGLCDGGMTVIMAEHKVEWLAERADRILALDRGRTVAWGPPRLLFGEDPAPPSAVPAPRQSPSSTRERLPVPSVTEACVALGWRTVDGGWPVTLSEAVAVGQGRVDFRAGEGRAPSGREQTEARPRGPEDPVIVAENIYFHYTPDAPVLNGISLEIGPGATAIIGQNGAGKSTFVRMLNGLLKPIRGSVAVRGVDTRDNTVATMARTVGLVFQNPSDQLFKSRVLDEVAFGPRNVGLSPDEAHQRAVEALRRVGLEHAATRNPYDLGLADRKLVTIAGVLAMNTEVIILDEPTIAQDEAGVARIGQLVHDLRADGRTIITITHDMDFVARWFERVLVFSEGTVLADGTAADVFARPDVLDRAALEAPQITRLGRALGLPNTVVTTEQFVSEVKQRPR